MNDATVITDSELEALMQKIKIKKSSALRIPIVHHRQKMYPIALSQEQLWILTELSDAPWYNVPLVLEIQGRFNHSLFEKCLHAIIDRHEILRTVFLSESGLGWQSILPDFSLSCAYHDLSLLTEDQRACEAEVILHEKATYHFSLDKEPAIQATVIKQSDNDWVAMILFHHLCIDGWSLRQFIQELSCAYQAYYEKKEPQWQPLYLQFLDFSEWQHQCYQSGNFEQQRCYWIEKLKNRNTFLALPTDFNRPKYPDYQGDHWLEFIPTSLSQSITELAVKLNVTDFILFLTAFALLLHHYSQEKEINIGCPVANRMHEDVGSIMGMFTNTLVMAIDINPNDRLLELIYQVKHLVLHAFENQQIPFDKIVEQLDIPREASYNPLFQVLFAYQNIDFSPVVFPDMHVSMRLANTKTAKMDLSVQLLKTAKGLELDIEYATSLFTQATMKQFARHYIEVLSQLTGNLDHKIAQCSLLTEEEQRIYQQWNATERSFDTPLFLHELFSAQARKTPDNVALVFEKQQITYKQLDDFTWKFSNYLRKMAVGPNQFIGIYLNRSLDMVLAIISVLKSEAAYLPIGLDYPLERIVHIVEEAELRFLITDSLLAQNLPIAETNLLFMDQLQEKIKDESELDVFPKSLKPQDAAYLIYTSGSTGKPKGVINAHQGIVNYIHARKALADLTAEDKFLLKTPYTFDVSIWEMFLPLHLGATLFILEENKQAETAYLLRFIQDNQISILHFVPSMLHLVLQEKDLTNCTSLRQIYCSGEPLTSLHVNGVLNQLNVALINLYGPTEAAIDVSYWPCSKMPANMLVPIGMPLANVQLYILDAFKKPVPIGIYGEIYIGGIAVASGYLKQPELNNVSFIKDPFSQDPEARLYRTGDFGRYRREGHIEILGRKDEQIKLRGFRIELNEIAHTIRSHQSVHEAVVVKHVDGKENIYLIAYVVFKDNKSERIEQLECYLKEKLLPYMQPSYIIPLTHLPLLTNGKMNKQALPNPKEQSRANCQILPETDLEKKLVVIWKDLLDAGNISTTDSFFQLGGHSLLAIQFISKLYEMTGIRLSLQSLLGHQSIKALAKLIEEKNPNITCSLRDYCCIDATNAHKPFSLNAVQEAYWIGKNVELELGNVAAHFYLEIKTTFVDPERWNLAINKLIARHPMLRMTVDEAGYQRIISLEQSYQLHWEDWTYRDQEKLSAQKRDFLSHKNYADNQYPLFDIHLCKLSLTEAQLFISFDLLICDAQSLYIIFDEMVSLLNNEQIEWSPLQFTFRDYILSEERFKHSEQYQHAATYWKNRIKDLPPAPELPLVKSLKQIKKPIFKRYAAIIEAKNWRHLQNLAAQIGVSPSVFLLSAFAYVLALWANNKKFTLNLTLFNRLPFHPDVFRLVGDFTNINLLMVDLNLTDSFRHNASKIQEQLWMDLEHRYYSGIHVLREYAKYHQSNSETLMPIVFTSTLTQDKGFDATVFDKLGSIIYNLSQTPQVYLDHQIYEYHEALHFHWDVVEEIFPPQFIEEMFTGYCDLLQAFVKQPQLINLNRVITIPEKHKKIIAAANATTKAFISKTLTQDFFNVLGQFSTKVAIFSPEDHLTYQQLGYEAIRLSQWLQQKNLQPQEQVAIILEKSWQAIAAIMGILHAGAAYLPIDPALPVARIAFLLSHSKIRYIVSEKSFIQTEAFRDYELYDLEHMTKERPEYFSVPEFLKERGQPFQLAYVMYTSGSTGQPKGVAISHESATNTIMDINQRFLVHSADTIFSLSALNFDLSVYDIFGLLSVGGSIIMPDKANEKDPSVWLDLMEQHEVTIWNSVPVLMELLVDYADNMKRQLPSSLRLILLSGDWIPLNLPDKIRAITKREVEIISLGGATEASIWSIYYPISILDSHWNSIPYGKPLTNQKFYVLNDYLEDCPLWVKGDLYIAGKGLALEYFQDKKRTEESFFYHQKKGERLYKTGDLGRYLPDAHIEFCGRKDRQIKIRGYRIELDEIEKNLMAHPKIKSALVLVHKNQWNSDILIAYVILQPHLRLEKNQVNEYLKSLLPTFMLPEKIIFMESWPISANNKIDLKALSVLDGTNIEKKEQGTELSDLTRKIQALLQTKDLNADTNLLEYGITSVDIVRIANMLEKDYGFRLKFREFYRYPTIRKIIENNINFIEEKEDIIIDLNQRSQFVLQKKWYRFSQEGKYIPLEDYKVPMDNQDPSYFQAQNRFSSKKIPIGKFIQLLHPLLHSGEKGHCYYPSFGNLYPIQVYIEIKPNKVEELAAGIYYYDTLKNALLYLSEGAHLLKSLHVPFVYQPIYEAASFSLFLIADLDAIVPLYGEESVNLCRLEAGYMSQALITSAALSDLALHPVGIFDFERAKIDFKLKPSHIYLHSLLGGLRLLEEETEEVMAWEYGEI